MNLHSVIVDYRLPESAIERLERYAEVFLFNAQNITFEAVNGHPDIFISQVDNQLVVAPNTPHCCIDFLTRKQIPFSFGKLDVGCDLVSSTPYNCVATQDLLLHKEGFTDLGILDLCPKKRFINLPQSFSRCSLFAFGHNKFITSDGGIYKVLLGHNLKVCFVEPFEILLPPYKNGFIGGCLGVLGTDIFLTGSITHLRGGNELKAFCNDNGFDLVELYDGPLLDVGGLLFV